MGKGYKLVKVKNGRLYPLYVFSSEETKMGEWLKAKEGPRNENGKVISKLGPLAFRPGFHVCTIPQASHIGKRQPDGRLFQAKDTVWVEVLYSDSINYQSKADEKGKNKNNEIIAQRAYLDYIPVNGYYEYKTNTLAEVKWIIAGEIKILRIVPQDEVVKICKAHGIAPQPLED